MTDEIRELTDDDFASSLSPRKRDRFMRGQIDAGEDVAALRRFVRLSQTQLARALGVSVQTLREWEQDREKPDGPAIALLRIAARHPSILRENLETAG